MFLMEFLTFKFHYLIVDTIKLKKKKLFLHIYVLYSNLKWEKLQFKSICSLGSSILNSILLKVKKEEELEPWKGNKLNEFIHILSHLNMI